jgi:hypothetical protein
MGGDDFSFISDHGCQNIMIINQNENQINSGREEVMGDIL